MGAGSSTQGGSQEDGLIKALTQRSTNGKSVLGTLVAPLLPHFLTNNPTPNGSPWSLLNSSTDYYHKTPCTGVIRQYDLTIGRDVLAPDGYERSVLTINGQFPGPLLEANWGDTFMITVRNNLTDPVEGTALHWHGFPQTGTPWEDGAPAISQCPIAPGESFTYTFQAELYGSTWYHSHYSAQYSGGLVGPMVVYGPHDEPYDVDLGPVMLSDWYHEQYYDLVQQAMAPGASGAIFSDNNLINGKMNFNCSSKAAEDSASCTDTAGIAKFKFTRGKTHRLRLMNVGSEALQRFTIDGHVMKVIANDFVPVEPYETKVVTLGIGQRTDVLVKADGGDLGAYWMRSNISMPCSLAKQPDARAVIYYDDADDQTTEPPCSQPWDEPDAGLCTNDDLSLTRPLMPLAVPEPDLTVHMDVGLRRNESNVTVWSLGGVEFRGNYNSPTLLLSNLGNLTFEEEWNVRNTGDAKSVRVVVRNKTPIPHPMHLHGFNMFILHEGEGDWDDTVINAHNPQRRDVFQLRGDGHLVMQFNAAENPGVWPFHCHIAWHASGGLFTQFLTKPDEVAKMRVPNVVAETCRQWGHWTNTNIPDQIDSGL